MQLSDSSLWRNRVESKSAVFPTSLELTYARSRIPMTMHQERGLKPVRSDRVKSMVVKRKDESDSSMWDVLDAAADCDCPGPPPEFLLPPPPRPPSLQPADPMLCTDDALTIETCDALP
ncbi:hypothetical protein GWI33_015527, partial [Rhynchophorus ferrugineus]